MISDALSFNRSPYFTAGVATHNLLDGVSDLFVTSCCKIEISNCYWLVGKDALPRIRAKV